MDFNIKAISNTMPSCVQVKITKLKAHTMGHDCYQLQFSLSLYEQQLHCLSIHDVTRGATNNFMIEN